MKKFLFLLLISSKCFGTDVFINLIKPDGETKKYTLLGKNKLLKELDWTCDISYNDKIVKVTCWTDNVHDLTMSARCVKISNGSHVSLPIHFVIGSGVQNSILNVYCN